MRTRIVNRAVISCLAAVAGSSGLGVAAASADTVLAPTNDTYVASATPATNFASATLLAVTGTPASQALLRFTAPSGAIAGAKLRLYATASSPDAISVRSSSCAWTTNTVNWNTRPALGTAIASKSSVSAGWNDIALPPTALTSGAANCLQVTKASGGRVQFEAILNTYPAQLVVTNPVTTLATSSGSCAAIGTTWCGDFDSANISQYSQVLGAPASHITFPSSPKLNGTSAARFELTPSDTWTDGTSRMQLRNAGWGEGTDLYFHVGLYIDPSTTIGGSFSNPWRALFTWPTTQDGRCSVGGFGLYNSDSAGHPNPSGAPALTMNGDNGICGGSNINYWRLFNPVKGAWYQFIVHRKFSYNASTGSFEFWLQKPGESTYTKQTFNNGSQRMTMRTIGCSGCSDNMRVGVYRNHSFGTTDVVDYDDIRAATSFAAAH